MKLLLLIGLSIPMLCFAKGKQSQVNYVDSLPKDLIYERVYETKGSKQDLYYALKRETIKMFKDANQVIQSEDSAKCELLAKGVSYFNSNYKDGSVHTAGQNKVFYIVEISVKNDKYRIRLYNYTTQSQATVLVATLGTANSQSTGWSLEYSFDKTVEAAKDKKIGGYSREVVKQFHLTMLQVLDKYGNVET